MCCDGKCSMMSLPHKHGSFWGGGAVKGGLLTAEVCAFSSRSCSPDSASQIRTVLSSDPDTTILPSGENPHEFTCTAPRRTRIHKKGWSMIHRTVHALTPLPPTPPPHAPTITTATTTPHHYHHYIRTRHHHHQQPCQTTPESPKQLPHATTFTSTVNRHTPPPLHAPRSHLPSRSCGWAASRQRVVRGVCCDGKCSIMSRPHKHGSFGGGC